MKQPEISQVLLMAHGWGYNHRFFNALLDTLPKHTRETTLFVCFEAGYFPEQGKQGLMINIQGEWVHHPAEALHSLVLAQANVPWLGLGHSLGFSKLLDFSVRWHSLYSLHGFTRFTNNRVLARMIRKAEENMPEVLADFHKRCGHIAPWSTLDERALLADLIGMQTLSAEQELQHALSHGAELYAWASSVDQIVPLALAQACFDNTLKLQGRTLFILPSEEHASIANAPARYTDALLPFLSQH
ncbi:hypothetical protein [Limnobacter sp.]|uniref:hypothetical protein n=1 Tax=Limnobacter sp. TaxID=2003368 RepID=UPI003747D1AC